MQTRTFSALRATAIQAGIITVRVGSKDGPLATGLKKEDGSPLTNPFPIPKDGRPAFQAENGVYWINLVGPGFNIWEEAQFLDVADVLAVDAAKEAAEEAAEVAVEAAAEAQGAVDNFAEKLASDELDEGTSLVTYTSEAQDAEGRPLSEKLAEQVTVADVSVEATEGVIDAIPAIRKAADEANRRKQKLILKGDFYLNSRGNISVPYGFDASEARFKFGPGAFVTPLAPIFVASPDADPITLSVDVAELKKYATNIPSIGSEYRNGLIFIQSNLRYLIRRQADAYVTQTVEVTKGSAGGTDLIPVPLLYDVVSVTQGGTTYTPTTDYTFQKNFNGCSAWINWSPAGAEPTVGSTYTVTYRTYNFLTKGEPNYLLKRGFLHGELFFDYTTADFSKTAPMTRSSIGDTDTLPPTPFVTGLTSVFQGSTTYVLDTDYSYDDGVITWLSGGVKPADGSTYYATYEYTGTVDGGPLEVTVLFNPDGAPTEYIGGLIDMNGESAAYRAKFLEIKRGCADVISWNVIDSVRGEQIDAANLFSADLAANVYFDNIYGDGFIQSVPGQSSYSYLFTTSRCFNVRYNRVRGGGGWGSFEHSFTRCAHITDSNIDRFDGHYEFSDYSADGCDIYLDMHTGSGHGYARITRCRKIVSDPSPMDVARLPVRAVISQRTDYGGGFDGDITIRDIEFVLSDDITTTNLALYGVAFYGTDGEIMLEEPIHFGKQILIDNIVINAPARYYSTHTLSFFGLRVSDATATVGDRPGTILPIGLTVTNVRMSLANQKEISNFNYLAASIDSVAAAPYIVSSTLQLPPGYQSIVLKTSAYDYAQGGNERGLYAVDFQQSRTDANQVASGAGSTISGGRNNRASGTNSSIGGGSGNQATAIGSTILGGINHLMDGDYSVGMGRGGRARGRYGAVVHAALTNGADGNQQGIRMTLAANTNDDRGQTQRAVANATSTTTGAASNQLSLDTNAMTINFEGKVTAQSVTVASRCKTWKFEGAINRSSDTVSFVGTPSVTMKGAGGSLTDDWSVDLVADTTNNALGVNVTGATGQNVRWHVIIDASEVK